VKVHLLDELLRTTVALPEARKYILDASFDERVYGPMATDALHNAFSGFDDDTLVEYLIGGMTSVSCSSTSRSRSRWWSRRSISTTSSCRRCRTTCSHRDTSAWIYGGVSINSMRMKARRRETIHYEAVYRWHPLFADADFEVWSEGSVNGPATAEGGDMLVLGRGAVLIGMSERTTPQGIERLARRLFAAGSTTSIVALALPQKRAFMHLDTVMTMVNEDTFTKYAGLGDSRRTPSSPATPRRSSRSPPTRPTTCTRRSPARSASTRSTCSPRPRT
jgi:arginine deiminase